MRTNVVGFLMLMAAFLTVGCGGPQAESVTAPKVSARDSIRKSLEGIAESGQSGSEVGAMMGELDKLAAEDAALADSLKADAEALMSITDPAAAKAKAKEMLDKLGGGGAAEPAEE